MSDHGRAAEPAQHDFFLFWPDAGELKAQGFAPVAHVPCVFDSNWCYAVIPSQYLRARARTLIGPQSAGPLLKRPRYPTKRSLKGFGHALVNFLEWCAATGRRWEEADYLEDIIEGYQADMSTGRWSMRGNPLKPRTMNGRVDEACKFLRWAASQGCRVPFEVPTVTTTRPSETGTSTHAFRRSTEVRVGAVRPDPITLRIPTDAEVTAWHESVRIESGPTKALMCELVLETGIRREETVQWQLDTLPLDPASWHRSGTEVMVSIMYGTKGPKRPDGRGGEVGPRRDIWLPESLALQLHHYREKVRPGLRAQFVRSADSLEEKRKRMRESKTQLFLSDSTGEPVSAQRFYDAWTGASRRPYPGWSVHLGRHWWSCKKLLRGCSTRLKIASLGPTYGEQHGVVTSTAIDIIKLIIEPQLGHVSGKTAYAYLVWIQRVLMLTSLHDDYEQELEKVVATFEV